MNYKEKVLYIQDNHFAEWLTTRKLVGEEISAKQSMFCVCKRLATGLHEGNCKRFQDKVTRTTVKRLETLIPAEVKK